MDLHVLVGPGTRVAEDLAVDGYPAAGLALTPANNKQTVEKSALRRKSIGSTEFWEQFTACSSVRKTVDFL